MLTNDAGTRASPCSSSTDPAHGTVTTNPDGSFTYTPAPGYTGPDQFDYTITDDYGQTDVATVHLTVTPLAVDDTWTTAGQHAPSRSRAPGVLGNDLGSGLTAGSPSDPPHGSVTLDPSGALVYTPDPGFSGTDTFTYVATDERGVRPGHGDDRRHARRRRRRPGHGPAQRHEHGDGCPGSWPTTPARSSR